MYTYGMKDDVSDVEFPQYSFQLVGATNGNGDWSELTGKVPNISVALKITPRKSVEDDLDMDKFVWRMICIE